MDASGRGEANGGRQDKARPLVCVVDDDGSVRRALCTLLRSAGFDSHAWAGAQEFLHAGMAAQCRCLIADLRMPGMDGFELQQSLRRSHPGVPVVFISAHADEPARRRALAAGAVELLGKPFSESALLHAVHRALEPGRP